MNTTFFGSKTHFFHFSAPRKGNFSVGIFIFVVCGYFSKGAQKIACQVPDTVNSQCREPEHIRVNNMIDTFLLGPREVSGSQHSTPSCLSVVFPTTTLYRLSREPNAGLEIEGPPPKSMFEPLFRVPSKKAQNQKKNWSFSKVGSFGRLNSFFYLLSYICLL